MGGGDGIWLSVSAPYGSGGLGQHFAQLVENARSRGRLAGYFCSAPKPGDEALGRRVRSVVPAWVIDRTPVRLSPGWRSFLGYEGFDRAAARSMTTVPATYSAFTCQALHSFRRARRLGSECLELVAACSHVLNVRERNRDAAARFGIEGPWLNTPQVRKALLEYELADRIQVVSEYGRESFLRYGVPETKLYKTKLKVHRRFRPAQKRPPDGTFRIVHVGALTVTKGIPVLLEAFARLPVKEAALTLVGGWSTRGMRRYLQGRLARDPRITIVQGNPLAHLQRADAYVHPSFQDGFGYAPAESLACGVPVIVTEDTGMKELVREGENGFVVPTGDVDAIVDRLVRLHERPMTLQP